MNQISNFGREVRMRVEGVTHDPLWRNHDCFDDGRTSNETITITINSIDARYLISLIQWQRNFWQRRAMGARCDETTTARAKTQRLSRIGSAIFQALKTVGRRPPIRSAHSQDGVMREAFEKARQTGG